MHPLKTKTFFFIFFINKQKYSLLILDNEYFKINTIELCNFVESVTLIFIKQFKINALATICM